MSSEAMSCGEKTQQLCDVIRKGDKELTERLLNSGDFDEVFSFPDNPEGALHVAALEGHTEIVRLLLKHRVDVHMVNAFGQIALHLACWKGHLDIVKLLIEASSDVDYKDCGECTPLFHAVGANRISVINVLIEAGCDMDTLNEELITPLDQAIICNQKKIVTQLIKGGCQWEKTIGVVYPDHYTSSILFSLWHNLDFDNIRLLINCGFKLDDPVIPLILDTLLHFSMPTQEDHIQYLNSAFHHPRSLKNTCRVVLRRSLVTNRPLLNRALIAMIEELPLPNVLKDFIAFKFEHD